jgi:transposase InsO family protein
MQIFAPIEAAQLSHPLYQQNASALCRQFHLTKEQAQQIITSSQQCVTCLPQAYKGVNPRGLWPVILWQMGVIHVSSFDWQYYVHVSVDIYSGYIYAFVHAGEATKHVITHCLAVFAAMGKPQQLKINNGPEYNSTAFQQFCEAYQIHHTTKVPCNPQGQSIVECTHATLKMLFKKLKWGDEVIPLASQLHKAFYALNFFELPRTGFNTH